ncbi:MAG: DinB family protein [Planctomycetes bacterium]|nr:DinB family protein [Planctomycetota bacterium]
MADTTLVLMFDEVRGSLLQVLDFVDEQMARWRPAGLQNTILWHAGHCCVVVEHLTMESLGRKPECPEGWFDLFGWNSRPGETPPEAWPRLETIIRQLWSQHARLRKLLASVTEDQLSAPHGDGTVRHTILHAFQDEAAHKGEIWLLQKLYRIEKQIVD